MEKYGSESSINETMFMKKIAIAVVVAIMSCVTSRAHAEPKKNWSDEAEISYVETGGNTDTSTFSLKNELKVKLTEKLSSSWKLGAISSTSGGVRNAESYHMELRGNYLFTKMVYAYLYSGWEKDTFAGLHSRLYAGPGLGYKLLIGPYHFLFVEAGINYVDEEFTDNTEEDFFSGRLFGKYEFVFNDVNKFHQSLEYLFHLDENEEYNVISETAITSALGTNYSLKASYTVKYDNRPVPGTLEKTDTILATALVANF